jgi:hypothetical protein
MDAPLAGAGEEDKPTSEDKEAAGIAYAQQLVERGVAAWDDEEAA